MVIEPTDEMVQAFGQGGLTEEGIREGLAAVLALVARDYALSPYCNAELMPGVVCKRWTNRHKHEANLPSGNRVEWE